MIGGSFHVIHIQQDLTGEVSRSPMGERAPLVEADDAAELTSRELDHMLWVAIQSLGLLLAQIAKELLFEDFH